MYTLITLQWGSGAVRVLYKGMTATIPYCLLRSQVWMRHCNLRIQMNIFSIQGFDEHTKLLILTSMPNLCLHICSFFLFCPIWYAKLNIGGYKRIILPRLQTLLSTSFLIGKKSIRVFLKLNQSQKWINWVC